MLDQHRVSAVSKESLFDLIWEVSPALYRYNLYCAYRVEWIVYVA